MLKVALTGNVASGKSSVARVWSDAGVPVVKADDLAREVVAPGSKGLRMVVEAFGPGILNPDGTLDRPALREIVFRNPGERTRLEGILHPLIGALRDDRVNRLEADETPMVVAEIPLLFETGLEEGYDIVVLVSAPREERLRRILEDRDLEPEIARGIMDSQMPDEEKSIRADFVLDNGGDLQDLRIRALALLDLLRARARKRGGS